MDRSTVLGSAPGDAVRGDDRVRYRAVDDATYANADPVSHGSVSSFKFSRLD
jgi:hypothetical protein